MHEVSFDKNNRFLDIHKDLFNALKVLYQPLGFTIMNVIVSPESKEYGACMFKLSDKCVVFRVAHITPTKIGQFVTLWKREGAGPIKPYEAKDQVDFFVISVRKGWCWGQFVFPKHILIEKGVLSKDAQGGKRALRVYPPWDITESHQAAKSQLWQNKYFIDLSDQAAIDDSRVKNLYEI